MRRGPASSATRDSPGAAGEATYPRPPADPSAARTLTQSKEDAEILRIHEALRRNHNNRLRAAAELGISRMGLYKKLHRYGLFDAGSGTAIPVRSPAP